MNSKIADNDTFSIRDAGFNIGVNVRVTKRDRKTGRILMERQGHNRCLKQQLVGLAKFLNGEFNETNHRIINNWIPRYLGVGNNLAVGEIVGVTSSVNINDTKLLNEIYPRLKLPEKNTIVNRSTQKYVQVCINTYLPEGWYVGETISEAGLFSNETGNNCLFRIVFDGIPVTEDSVVEISWVISIISVDSENQPYVESDKDDLFLAMKQILNRISLLHPELKTVCDDIIDSGIPEYGRSDSTQDTIDEVTKKLVQDYAMMPLPEDSSEIDNT